MRLAMLHALLADLRHSSRHLRSAPGFSLVAITTLALGIGATTAMFSVVDHVLLRSLPYERADRLHAVHEVMPTFAHIAPLLPVNAMHFSDWQRHTRSFDGMALVSGMPLNLTGAGDPQRLNAARVSPSLFSMLGVQAQLGRTFLAEEDVPGRDHVVLLEDRLWRTRFGADPGIVGRRLVLDGEPYEVVGVLPPTFSFPRISQLYAMSVAEERPQIWKPFGMTEAEAKRDMGDFNYACIVSLKPDVSPAAAEAELNARQASLVAHFPMPVELFARLVPLHDQITGRSRAGLQMLLGAVGLVLLIACVNVANLLLARATGRHREFAVRSALGATGRHLARQLLVESVLLSILGGAGGVLLAYATVGAVASMAPADVPRIEEIAVDGRILLFTLAISIGCGLLFGLVPAWRVARAAPQAALQTAARGNSGGRAGGRVRSWLVASEVALSAVCLVVGGLLLHSLVKLTRVDVGFTADRVVAMDFTLPHTRYASDADRVAFVGESLRQLRAVPGIEAAGIVNKLPLSGEGGNNLVAPEGTTWAPLDRPIADVRQVDPVYFQVVEIALRSGRLFTEADADHEIVVVSASTAERLWPGQDPVGRRLLLGPTGDETRDVIGVVGDVRSVSAKKAPMLTIYVPYWQGLRSELSLVVASDLGLDALAAPMRSAIARVDPELPVAALRPMHDLVRLSLAEQRFQTMLVLFFGAAASLLACLGIYGVVSYSVAQRTTELGIRLALGARPLGIRAVVLRQGLTPVAAGLVVGLLVSSAAGRVIGSLLYEVSPGDPATLSGVVLTLLLVAAAGTWLPARRATRVDPMSRTQGPVMPAPRVS
jgi:predicted permease